MVVLWTEHLIINSVNVGQGTITKQVQFKCDPFGRKIEKNLITNGIPEVSNYIYDNANIIQEEGANTAKYIYGQNIDEPITLIKDGNRYYYHSDKLGTITALTDTSGSLLEEYKYDPFGKILKGSSIGNPYFFTGRRYDSEIGLYYYRARYYDPETGRFISTDPIGYKGGLNLYAYVHNNPVNWIDPWGLYDVWKLSPGGGCGGGMGQPPGIGNAPDPGGPSGPGPATGSGGMHETPGIDSPPDVGDPSDDEGSDEKK